MIRFDVKQKTKTIALHSVELNIKSVKLDPENALAQQKEENGHLILGFKNEIQQGSKLEIVYDAKLDDENGVGYYLGVPDENGTSAYAMTYFQVSLE